MSERTSNQKGRDVSVAREGVVISEHYVEKFLTELLFAINLDPLGWHLSFIKLPQNWCGSLFQLFLSVRINLRYLS